MGAETLRVLVVDDEDEFAQVLTERLHFRGLKAWMATSGEQALQVARENPFDAAIVDLQMPGMGGLECIAKLKALYPELRVALLTGAADAMAQQGAQALGCLFFQKTDMAQFWDFIAGLRGD